MKRYGTTGNTSDYVLDDAEALFEMDITSDPMLDFNTETNEDKYFHHMSMGGQVWINAAKYHPAEVGQQDEWQGQPWRDMPGTDSDNRKLNFFLFRRGLYDAEANRDSNEAARQSICYHFRNKG